MTTFRLILAAAFLAALPAAGGENAAGTALLDSSGFWRVHHTLRTPVVGKRGSAKDLAVKCETELPPKEWHAPGFDDSGWRRLRGHPFPFTRSTWMKTTVAHLGSSYMNDCSPCMALICMRGRFIVDNPAAVRGMTLAAEYRGGMVVYLNGKEVARATLAKGGGGLLDLADDYPVEAFVAADGKALQSSTKTMDRLKLRTRRLAAVAIPSSALKRGVNVLAVEIHRTAFPQQAADAIGKSKQKAYSGWNTAGLISLRLSAASAAGARPNVVRPDGLQVWNSTPLSTDFDLDFGDPCEELHPIRLAGTRGGAFSGKVVVGSRAAIKGLSARASDLSRKGGGRISSSSLQVRYGTPSGREGGSSARYPATPTRFDPLVEKAPGEVPVRSPRKSRDNWVRPGQPKYVPGAVVPVWVTVNVPRDAAGGDYAGKLTVAAAGMKPVTVPVELSVAGWTLPEPKDYRTFVELIQSPDSVAMQYDVKPWSDRHFELMAKSFELLGKAGSRSVYIPLITETNLGNPESMVRWQKAGSGYTYDLSIMKRYLDLAARHQGKPQVVCLYVWDVFLEGGFLRYPKTGKYARPEIFAALDKYKDKGPRVTTIGAGGKAEEIQLPQYSKPEGSGVHWKKLFDAIRAEMKKRGLEKSMTLGIPNDAEPTKEIVAFFNQVAPGVPWIRQAHSFRKNVHGAPYVLQELVWSTKFNVWPDTASKRGWKNPTGNVQFARNVTDGYPMTTFRLIGEMNIIGGQRGFGRFGADFWPVLEDKRGRKVGTLCNRWPHVDWRNLTVKTTLLAPGPDGALSTARFEMLREGVQETEARIFIEDALESGRVKGALARKCTELLDSRAGHILQGLQNHYTCGFEKAKGHNWWNMPGQSGYQYYVGSGWQKSSTELYTLAAEVAKATGGR